MAKTATKKKSTSKKKSPSRERLKPIIREGSWVLLTTDKHKDVPDEFRGLEAVVVRAPVEHVQGNSKAISPRNYERQDDDTVFLVRVRERSQTHLQVHRDAFAMVSRDRGSLRGP